MSVPTEIYIGAALLAFALVVFILRIIAKMARGIEQKSIKAKASAPKISDVQQSKFKQGGATAQHIAVLWDGGAKR